MKGVDLQQDWAYFPEKKISHLLEPAGMSG